LESEIREVASFLSLCMYNLCVYIVCDRMENLAVFMNPKLLIWSKKIHKIILSF